MAGKCYTDENDEARSLVVPCGTFEKRNGVKWGTQQGTRH